MIWQKITNIKFQNSNNIQIQNNNVQKYFGISHLRFEIYLEFVY